jgi:hypothetical protein
VVDVKRQGDRIILVKLVLGCSLEHYKCMSLRLVSVRARRGNSGKT